ncbi:alcohol dehydrogenase [Aspergillus sp. HF37]|nr:alcohol dehydrogenase [Aspergillus sp. HF37]
MSQNALQLQQVGSPLVLSERPIPVPGENELLVRVTSAGLNPHDDRSRDWAGEVLKVGSGDNAAKYQVGEHVFAQARLPGDQVFNDFYGLQQYALVDPRFAAKVPETGLSDDEAATIPVNVASVLVALFHSTGLGLPIPGNERSNSTDLSGQAILIVGAGSNCGRTGVQFAKMAGFGTIIAYAGPSNQEELKTIGATHFVDRHAGNALDQIRSVVGDEPIYALDAVNFGPQQALGAAALLNSKKGTLITFLPADGELDAAEIGPKNAGYDRRMTFGRMTQTPEFAPEFWTRIT